MRILQLRFKNLNSLAGEWKIDFTDPTYISSGIFAITGPTGSGKTTILDAICLALYGKTPRLKIISKSTNEIMTRNTGECFAEVVFESQMGQFVCHWSQRRAYGKPDGELQQPKHEISNNLSKTVLENKLTRVTEKVIETTGLDYHQFTRSIMLAQGDFAAFLNANPDERAPILEKITGTEIYSEISKKVYERNTFEVNKRREIKEKIGNIDVLSPDEILELKRNCEQIKGEVQKILSDRDSFRQAVTWLQNISRLEQEIVDLNNRKRNLEEKRIQSTKDLDRLSRARKTLAIKEVYSKLESARDLADSYEREIKESSAMLETSEISHKELLLAHESSRIRLETLKKDLDDEKRVIVKVRDLDTLIGENKQQIAEKNRELKSYQDKILEYQAIISTNEKESEEKQHLLETTVKYLEEHEEDGGLSENLSGFEERLIQYSRFIKTLELNKKQLESRKEELTQINDVFSEQRRLFSEKEKRFEEATVVLNSVQVAYNQLLDNRGPEFWRDCTSSLKERKRGLESELNILVSIEKIGMKIRDLKEKRAGLEERLGQEKDILSGLIREQEMEDEILVKIEANLELLHRVESLEEERKRLEDGKPCPLCGSSDHPYVKGRAPDLEGVKSEWVIKKGELKDLSEKVRFQEASISKLKAEILLNEKTEQERRDRIQELLDGSSLGFDDLEFVTGSSDLKKTIQKALMLCDWHFELCRDVSESADKMEKNLNKKKEAVELAKDGLNKQKTECRAAEVERGICAKNITGLEDQIAVIETDHAKIYTELLNGLQNYGIDSIKAQNISEIIQSLKQRKKDFETALNQKREFENDIELFLKDIDNNRRQIIDEQKSSESLLQAIGDKERKLLTLSNQRSNIYGIKDPNTEEKKLAEDVEIAEKNFKTASDRIHDCRARITSLKDQRLHNTDKLNKTRCMLEDLEREFQKGIRLAGLLSEDDFLSACITHDQFEILEKLEEDLLIEERNISSRFEDNTRLLEQEKAKGVTDMPMEDLERKILVCEDSITDLNRRLGSINQILEDYNRSMTIQKDLFQALEKQEIECLRWEKLHDLIGSADGKKFRVFAQGLTFDRLIAHANKHLRKMSDRYLLIRRESSSLDLEIIDNYQAGEIRSTKNLSGGESFIVSLALALGLSGMASKNVRIDSLFLDEGFGTLDDETLEIALETLSTLQQEGKIIGIISHVPALKERISTKIVVEKTSEARSRLIAPGCTSAGT